VCLKLTPLSVGWLFTSMCTQIVWSLTPFATPGYVLSWLVCLFDDVAGLALGFSPVSRPSSCLDVPMLSRGGLHQGFMVGNAGRRLLFCIVFLVGDAGILCPLSLLDDLHNCGEVLSCNAFASYT